MKVGELYKSYDEKNDERKLVTHAFLIITP